MKEVIKVNRSKKSKIIKFIALVIFCIIALMIFIAMFPVITSFGSEEARMEFKESLSGNKLKGAMFIAGLQTSQVIIPMLPGEPMEVLAGICFGPVGGLIFMLILFWFATAIIFYLVRKIGVNFVYTFCNDDLIEKIQNSKVFKNPKVVERVLYILYLTPLMPKDFFTYMAGLLPLEKPMRFITLCTLARIPSIVSSTIAGAGIIEGTVWVAIWSYVIVYSIVSIGIVIYMKISKDKEAKEALELMAEKYVKKENKSLSKDNEEKK